MDDSHAGYSRNGLDVGCVAGGGARSQKLTVQIPDVDLALQTLSLVPTWVKSEVTSLRLVIWEPQVTILEP